MDEIGAEDVDAHRASVTISSVTWLKELEILGRSSVPVQLKMERAFSQ